jgi:hypothetical protein
MCMVLVCSGKNEYGEEELPLLRALRARPVPPLGLLRKLLPQASCFAEAKHARRCITHTI